MTKWKRLKDLLEKKSNILDGFAELLGMYREIENMGLQLKEMEVVVIKIIIIIINNNNNS